MREMVLSASLGLLESCVCAELDSRRTYPRGSDTTSSGCEDDGTETGLRFCFVFLTKEFVNEEFRGRQRRSPRCTHWGFYISTGRSRSMAPQPVCSHFVSHLPTPCVPRIYSAREKLDTLITGSFDLVDDRMHDFCSGPDLLAHIAPPDCAWQARE